MTTKFKVSAGFAFMVLLLAAAAVLGNNAMRQMSGEFERYKAEAGSSVGANGADAMIRDLKDRASRFRLSLETRDIDTAKRSLERAVSYLEAAKQADASSGGQEELKQLIAKAGEMERLLARLQDNMIAANAIVREQIIRSADGFDKALQKMATAAKNADNANLSDLIAETYTLYVNIRVNIRHFTNVFDDNAAKTALEGLARLTPVLQRMEGFLLTAGGHVILGDLQRLQKEFLESFNQARALINEGNQAYTRLDEIGTDITSRLDSYTAQSEKSMNGIGTAIGENNLRTQSFMLAAGSVGVLLGAAFAGWIIFTLVRTLNRISTFAARIARGEFSATLDVREGGEFGAMAEALREIPAVLNTVMDQGRDLSRCIAVGHFRKRFDVAAFSGGFADLTRCINQVGDAYTLAIDSIPSPILAFDGKCASVFLNSEARKVLPGNVQGVRCDDLLRPAASLEAIGRNVMKEDRPQSVEAALSLQGKKVMADGIITPLHDLDGKADGFLGIFTDVTEVKNAQELMLRVAHEAMELADRVAAASEELSAQVEQVSQGAELQRARVESTATAMSEMNSTVLEVARNAGYASEQSGETRQRAGDGAALVNRVVESINGVNSIATGLQSNMAELGKQAENIGGVMNVISDIADQTNLLALNAAIEAARAGEAGRGFAVVADEVRKLAEKTMDATHQVGASINAIQQSARSNIDEVVRAVKNVGEATELANASGRALDEILTLAGKSSDVVANIATAAEEQSATSEEINRSLEEVSRVVAETAEGMFQSSAAVQDLSRTAQELKQVMERLQ